MDYFSSVIFSFDWGWTEEMKEQCLQYLQTQNCREKGYSCKPKFADWGGSSRRRHPFFSQSEIWSIYLAPNSLIVLEACPQYLNQSLQQLNNPSKRWRFLGSTKAKIRWKSSSLYPSFSDWIGAHFCSSICKFCGQLCTHIFGWLGINSSMTALNSGLGQQTTSFQNVFYTHIKVW